MNTPSHTTDLQRLIAHTLRWGVTVACCIALCGGVLYLVRHDAEPMPDYRHFSYDSAATQHTEYTTLAGIWHGICAFTARSWIQLGVLVLLLTPLLRVLISLIGFLRERDWLYAAITAFVLSVIVLNSIGGC